MTNDFNIRSLCGEDWRAYKTLRLEALRLCGDKFGASYETEASMQDNAWQELMRGNGHQCFGLFKQGELVGITAVFTDGADASASTAILAASYIREDYRGRGLSRLLYQARLDWIRESGRFERIEVGHRQGNESSRRANQAFGFQYIGERDHRFGDGSIDKIHVYEMRLR